MRTSFSAFSRSFAVFPPAGYFDDAPAIHIDDWRQLEEVPLHLCIRPILLQEKDETALNWWQSKCSEQAIGRGMARRINEQFDIR